MVLSRQKITTHLFHHPLLWIILLALILRLPGLNQSLWLDEAINVTAARDFSFSYLISEYSIGDFHPPLYHLILKSWIQLINSTEIAARTPSLLFGLLTIFFLYHLGNLLGSGLKLGNHRLSGGFTTALLLATSSLHLYYSNEARMYSLATCATTAAIFFLVKLRHQLKHPQPYQLGLFISLVVLLYSDYLPWFLLPIFLVFAPFITVFALLTLIPWVPFLYAQLQQGTSFAQNFPLWGQVVGGLSIKSVALIPIKFLIGRTSLDNNLLYAGALITPLLATLISLVSVLKSKFNRSLIIISLWFALPLAVGILISLKIPVISYFRFLFILPAFYLLITIGIHRLNNRLSIILLIVFLATNLTTSFATIALPQFHRENWRDLSLWINQINSQAPTAAIFPSLLQTSPYLYYQTTTPAVSSIRDLPELPEAVFLIRYVTEIFDPTETKKHELEALGYQFIESRNYNGVVVWLYLRHEKVIAAKP